MKLLISILVASVLILVFDVLASILYLYWTIWWFDIFMHTFGGLIIGLCILWILQKLSTKVPLYLYIWLVVLGVLVVGMGWELFEVFTGITDISKDLIDTIQDLICDTLGGLIAFWLSRKLDKEII